VQFWVLHGAKLATVGLPVVSLTIFGITRRETCNCGPSSGLAYNFDFANLGESKLARVTTLLSDSPISLQFPCLSSVASSKFWEDSWS